MEQSRLKEYDHHMDAIRRENRWLRDGLLQLQALSASLHQQCCGKCQQLPKWAELLTAKDLQQQQEEQAADSQQQEEHLDSRQQQRQTETATAALDLVDGRQKDGRQNGGGSVGTNDAALDETLENQLAMAGADSTQRLLENITVVGFNQSSNFQI
jgi:hypothetical protein